MAANKLRGLPQVAWCNGVPQVPIESFRSFAKLLGTFISSEKIQIVPLEITSKNEPDLVSRLGFVCSPIMTSAATAGEALQCLRTFFLFLLRQDLARKLRPIL